MLSKIILLSFIINLFAFTGLYPYSSNFSCNCNPDNFTGSIEAADTNWPVLMADTFIERHPLHISYDSLHPKWDYEQGVMLHAIWAVYKKTGEKKYFDYIKKDIDYYLTDGDNIKTYDINKFRLDDITPGRTVLDLYEATKDLKYKKTVELLRKQLSEQPRTPEGGFWHKKIYPEQMWLDGLYMAEPFYARYAVLFNEPDDFKDITKQFILMSKHGRDPRTGLYYHGWDYSKKQKWADPRTGDSPIFWGRSMGWYLMGLVDVLDYLPKENPDRQKLIKIFRGLCKALLKYQDKNTHLWYNVIDQSERKGNYLESSTSAMFMYAYAKGANEHYLDKKYLSNAKKIFSGIKNNMIRKGADGKPSLINTCAGAGLGGVPYRDGSFQYYANVPKSTDDFKGIGPFIMGALQLEGAGFNLNN
jgi:unsaturated rhamnogalacturonyl hydrolase